MKKIRSKLNSQKWGHKELNLYALRAVPVLFSCFLCDILNNWNIYVYMRLYVGTHILYKYVS